MNPPGRAARRHPRTCIWEITGACNLRCVHCSNASGSRHPRELPYDRLVEVAGSLARLGCRTVEITGGEPLLHPSWDRLAREASGLAMQVALVTNGLLLDDATIERALAAGVGHVGISIDGLRATHDATRLRPDAGPSPWDAAVSALRRSAARLPTTAITQVNRHNLGELPAMRALLADLGVPRWQIQLAVPTGRLQSHPEPYVISPADLEPLAAFVADAIADGRPPAVMASDSIGYYTDREKLIGRRPTGQGMWVGCLAGIRSVAITCDGRVRGCSMLPPDFDAGDLHDETFEAIWSDERRFAHSTRYDVGALTGACAKCPHGPLCRAGCTSMAWWTTGTIHENPYCLHRLQTESPR